MLNKSKLFYCLIISCILCFVLSNLNAQPGSTDNTFNPFDIGRGIGDGVNFGSVTSSLIQADGKIVIAGTFTAFAAYPTTYIVRLQPDGKIDSSFVSTSSNNGLIYAIAIQSDGKIIVAGSFTSFGGNSVGRIARMNSNGTYDNTFNVGGAGFNGTVTKLVIQPDDKILAIGSFGIVNTSTTALRVARLLANGNSDASFSTGSSTNSEVSAIALQPDGKIILGGDFIGFNLQNNFIRLARLETTGAVDPTFNLSTGATAIVRTISVFPSGKILIGGEFGTVNGAIKYRAAVLNANGTVDNSFTMSTPYIDRVFSSAIQSDGKILLGLSYYSNTLNPGSSLIRLNPDSSPDTSFQITTGANATVNNIWITNTNNILATGFFTAYNDCTMRGVAMIKPDGICNENFMQADGANGNVYTSALQVDGKILLGGSFTGYKGKAYKHIVRIFPDGEIDTTFQIGKGFSSEVRKIVLQPDGKILVGGFFQTYNDSVAKAFIRLLPNGKMDTSFHQGTGFVLSSSSPNVFDILVESNGDILIGGRFSQYNLNNANAVLRVNTNGTFINTYPLSGTILSVRSIAKQSDGKLFFGGSFTAYGSTSYNRIVRVNPNGSVDNTFFVGTGFNSDVYKILIQPDGKIVVGGIFTTFKAVTRQYLIRLTDVGNLDPVFGGSATTLNNLVNDFYLQPNGKLIVGGKFTNVLSTGRNRLVRFNSDASIDNTFIGTIPSNAFPFAVSEVFCTTPLPSGKFLAGGDFIFLNSGGKNRVARLFADCVNATIGSVTSTSSQLCIGDSATLQINGANLNNAQKWYWYKNGCGVTLVDSGTSIIVHPTTTTTYYVRGEGGCVIPGGCSSITIQVDSFSGNAIQTVSSCNSYVWFINGLTYTNSGTYTASYTNAQGCTSTRTLQLTILQPSIANSSISACNSYTFGGITFTNSGVYTNTFTNVNGCDSLHTIALTMFYTSYGASSVIACNHYIFGGITYTASGVYTKTFTSNAGCDSVHSLTLTIGNSAATSFSVSACSIYVWEGITYTNTDSYTRTFTNALGCDSVRTLNLTIQSNLPLTQFGYITQSTINAVKLVNLSSNTIISTIPVAATPVGATVSADGSKVFVAHNINYGQISVISTNTNTVIDTIYAGTYPFQTLVHPNGNTLFVVDNYSVHFVNTTTNYVYDTLTFGSIQDVDISADGSTMYVSVGTVSNGFIYVVNTSNRIILDTITLSWIANGIKISADGSKMFAADAFGDGFRVYNFLTNTSSALIPTGNYPIDIATSPNESRAYVINFSSNNVSVLNLLTNTVIATIPVGLEPREVNVTDDGKEVYIINSNSTFMTRINAVTNTSLANVNLGNKTFGKGKFLLNKASITAASCGPFVWNGTTYTSSGFYTYTASNIFGCDSLSTLNLTVSNANIHPVVNVQVCASYTWLVDGITYTSSGVYHANYVNASGCDSSYTLQLTIQNSFHPITSIFNCVSYTWPVTGLTYTASGIYTASFANMFGCDSSKILSLTIGNNSTRLTYAFVTDTLSASLIRSFSFNPYQYTPSVSISDPSPFGYSVNKAATYVYITSGNKLHILHIPSNTITHTVVFPDSAKGVVASSINDRVYVTFPYSNKVRVVDGISGAIVDSILVGNFPFGIAAHDNANRIYVTNQNGNSVSVIQTTTNTVVATVAVGLNPTGICVSATANKVYVANTNSNNVSVINSNTNTIITSFSRLSPYAICVSPNDQFVYVSSEVDGGVKKFATQVNYQNTYFYDSWTPVKGVSLSADGSLLFISIAYSVGNFYGVSIHNTVSDFSYGIAPTSPSAQFGNFVGDVSDVVFDVYNCGPYTWHNTTYTTSGIYSNTFYNASLCDSVSRINLTIFPIPTDTQNVSVCSAFTWYGNTYSSTGTYTYYIQNQFDCDSVKVLNLTILPNSSSLTNYTACDSFIWNGITYTNSGAYSATYLNVNGCDSVANLQLTLQYSSNATLSKAYIPNTSSDNVSVINLQTNQLITNILVGDGPIGVAFSPDNSKVYVINSLAGTMSVIQTSTNIVIHTIPLLASPRGIAVSVDGTKIYITHNTSPAKLSVLHSSTFATITSLTILAQPTWVSVSADGAKVYISGTNVQVLNTATNTITSTISVGGTSRYILPSVDGAKLYVSGFSNTVKVINAATNTVTNTITLANAGTSTAMALSADGSNLYVAQTAANRISVIQTNTNTILQTITTANGPSGLALNLSNDLLYVLNQLGNSYSVLNTSSFLFESTTAVGATPQTYGNFIRNFVMPPIAVTSCGSYVWHGTTYTTSGLYSFITENTFGCDSLSSLQLIILPTSNNVTNIESCSPYVWQGQTYTSSGTYTNSYINSVGCDSLQTLVLQINTPTYSSSIISSAISYTWSENGLTYTSSGTYVHTYLNSVGCIHTSTLQLTITGVGLVSAFVSQDQSVSCFGLNDGSIQAVAFPAGNYSYQLDGGLPIFNTGFFNGLTPGIHTVCISDGISTICDTVFIHEPAPLDIIFTTDSLVSCQGNDGALSIQITGGTALLQPFLTWWTNSNGDTLNNVLTNNFATSLHSLPSGNYTVRVEDDHGCFYQESVFLQQANPIGLQVLTSPILCNGEQTNIQVNVSGGVNYTPYTVLINGGIPMASYGAGTYSIQATDAKGCNVSSIFTLTEPGLIVAFSQVNACPNYSWNGTNYTLSGNYTATFTASNNCDSVHTLQLTIQTGVRISPKVFLGGAYIGNGLMHDLLRTNNQIPLYEPYTNLNFMPINSTGGEMTTNAQLSVSGNDAIVDWVHVEIRLANAPYQKIATQNALLQRDGDVVDVTGNDVLFSNVCPGNYRVSIKHRNHLGVMTVSSQVLSATTQLVDFTNSNNVWNKVGITTLPMKQINNLSMLWAGDARIDKNVKYNGSANDKDVIFYAVGINSPNNILTPVYRKEDVNLDAKVKYNNTDNDKNFILNEVFMANTLLTIPNTVIRQHTPD